MKVKLLLILLVFSNSHLIISQNDTIFQHIENKLKERAKFDSILNRLNNIASINNSDKIGKLSLKTEDVTIYKDSTKSHKFRIFKNDTWKIDREEINIEDGFITDILVVLKNQDNKFKYFTNKSPISLPRFFHYNNWKLREEGKRKNFILLIDVLRYEAQRENNYVPDNEKIKLENKTNKDSKNLSLNKSLNSLLNFRIYTDFLGLINEESNGIINFEAYSKIFLVPNNIGLVHFFKDVKPYLNYSRFDNNNRFIKTQNDTITHKLSLKQKAYITTGINFNTLEFKIAKEYPFSISIPAKVELNIVESDSTLTRKSKSKLNTITYGLGFHANFRRINNFGLNIAVEIDRFRYLKSNGIVLKNNSWFTTLGTSAELYYYENKESAFFIRFNSRRLISEGDENYATIQFGYKTALNFSKK